jgi:hypothetical protein
MNIKGVVVSCTSTSLSHFWSTGMDISGSDETIPRVKSYERANDRIV